MLCLAFAFVAVQTSISRRCTVGSQTYFRSYHLKTFVKLHLYHVKLLAGRHYVHFLCFSCSLYFFYFSSQPPLLYLRLRVASGMDSCQGLFSVGEQGPPVCCFPHSSALTSAWLQEGRRLDSETAMCGKRPLTSTVWLVDPHQSGGPTIFDSGSPHNNVIRGMLYIPHVVLLYKLDRDA